MYHIRKCQSTTIKQSSDVASIDPDKLECIGYTGNTKEEFLEFISNNTIDLEKLDDETKVQVIKLLKYKNWDNDNLNQDNWFEIGELEDNKFSSDLNTLSKNFDF